jgi:hypothetical protein
MAYHLNECADAQSTEIAEQIWLCNLDKHEASPANGFEGAVEDALSDPCGILHNGKTLDFHADMQGAFVSYHGVQRFSHTHGTHDLVALNDV